MPSRKFSGIGKLHRPDEPLGTTIRRPSAPERSAETNNLGQYVSVAEPAAGSPPNGSGASASLATARVPDSAPAQVNVTRSPEHAAVAQPDASAKTHASTTTAARPRAREEAPGYEHLRIMAGRPMRSIGRWPPRQSKSVLLNALLATATFSIA